jgi:hypothetical protein
MHNWKIRRQLFGISHVATGRKIPNSCMKNEKCVLASADAYEHDRSARMNHY